MKEAFTLLEYVAEDGKKPFSGWLGEMKDLRGLAVIETRIKRLVLGNFGDSRRLSPAVWELRVDFGPGYRVYFGKAGASIILLLCGGDKATQKADIRKAGEYWKDYRRRTWQKNQ